MPVLTVEQQPDGAGLLAAGDFDSDIVGAGSLVDLGEDARVVHQVIGPEGQPVFALAVEEAAEREASLGAAEELEGPGEAVADALAFR